MKPNVPRTLGAKIRALRLERSLTQGELTRGEITAGLISQIESDRVAPSFRVIQLLAEQLGIEPHELMSDVESRSLQLQILKEAREYLHLRKGKIALALLQQLELSPTRYIPDAELYLELAHAKQLVGQVDEAFEIYADIENNAMIHKDLQLGANCMTRQGDLSVELGRLPQALYCYKKALSYLQTQQHTPFISLYDLRKTIGILLYRSGNTLQALSYIEESYSNLQAREYGEQLAETCNMLSVLHAELKHRSEAFQFADAAIVHYQSLGLDVQALDARLNQAMISRELGEYEAALSAIVTVLADYYEKGIQAGLAEAWLERSICELEIGQIDDASRSLELAANLVEQDTLQYAQILRLQGQILMAKGSYEEASVVYNETLDILEKFHVHATSIRILKDLERVYMALDDPKKALRSRERELALTAITEQMKFITSIIV